MAKKKNNKKKPKPSIRWGKIGGLIGSAISMKAVYDQLLRNGWKPERAMVTAITAWDVGPSPANDFDSIMLRMGRAWGPAIAGYGVSEVVGNARGAVNSGIGFKVNSFLPWYARV